MGYWFPRVIDVGPSIIELVETSWNSGSDFDDFNHVEWVRVGHLINVIQAKDIKGTGQKITLELGKIKGQCSGTCPSVWLRAHEAADHIIVLNDYFTKDDQ